MKNLLFCVWGLFFLSILPTFAQIPATQPTPPDDEPIKISTEEIKLNVMAQNEYGRFDPTLVKDDLLIVEDGLPQKVESLARTPANVLFLLDTGEELNYAKNTFQTGIVTEIILRNLQPDDYFSILQYNNKVETIIDWTNNPNEASAALNSKMFAGKRSALSAGISAAIENLKSRPAVNRHLVLITDGIESSAEESERQKAFQKLSAADITVHVLSYTMLEEQKAQKATQRLKLGDGKTKPRLREEVMDQIIAIIPDDPRKGKLRRFIKMSNEAQKLVIFQIDGEWIKRVRQQRELWRAAEAELTNLTEETGGVFLAPEDIESMLKYGQEIAQAIDSHYVVTYIPKRLVSEVSNKE
ncbi:MAG TPA: VWA domain-containing protein, partial [Pyrinomonadaceae bacterium]|nr:VWA domain-containing protein [Pyrinomonadaceae bacterium]